MDWGKEAGAHVAWATVLAALLLEGCDAPSTDNRRMVVVRLHGDGKVGEACEAQSDCGYRQRCVYRGEDVGKAPVVEKGLCEADVWPGGCFVMLPTQRRSAAEKAEARREAQGGVPIRPLCH